MLEQIDFVVTVHTLHHCSNTLKTHTGIDRGLGQRRHAAIGAAIKLHKDDVPDFNITVAIFLGRTWQTAFNIGAMVVKYFCAGAAGAGIAHRPEIV